MRDRRPDIEAVHTATKIITLDSGQCFYETPKAYEIWQDEPLRRVLRIPKKRVVWVIERG